MDVLDALKGPWLHVVELDSSALTDRFLSLAAADGELAVRFVRGRKMATEAGAFDEFAAAFQFPYYFGENWDAFSECIADLAWMPASRYVTVITDAHAVLSSTEDRFRTLVEILASVGHEWSQSAPNARPFHVVLQTTPSERARLVNRLREAGVGYDMLE